MASLGDALTGMDILTSPDGWVPAVFGAQVSPTQWQVDDQADNENGTEIRIAATMPQASPSPSVPQDQVIT